MRQGKEPLTSGLATEQLAEQQACLAVSEFRQWGDCVRRPCNCGRKEREDRWQSELWTIYIGGSRTVQRRNGGTAAKTGAMRGRPPQPGDSELVGAVPMM